jgi:hypothetical protein
MSTPVATRRRALGCVLGAVLGMLVIAPAAGAAASGVDINTVEGQSFTGDVVSGLTCPLNGTATITIDWGDGTMSAGSSDGGTGIQGTHTYADEGQYSGTVFYSYDATPENSCPFLIQTTSFQATVPDAPLTAAGVDVAGTAGQPLSGVVAHIADANLSATADDFTVQINWGDGTSSNGLVGNSTSGGFDVSGTHTYAAAGNYPVTTSLTDAIGSAATTADSTARITSAPPPPPVVPATIIVSGPVGVTSDLEPRFAFISTVAGSVFQCALDPGLHGAKWIACASPHFTARLAAGTHTFEVRSTSPAGVTDPTGAKRTFEVRPAASTEERRCIMATWAPPSIGGALFGGKGTMDCAFQFSCPEWYDCVLSGQLTFSFAMPADHAAYIDVPNEVVGSLQVYESDHNKNTGFCVPEGQQYRQSGETYYCSRAGQITIHGRAAGGQPSPSVLCLAFTFVDINPGNWFNSQLLGCDAVIRRTWAPGVAHAHPLIQLVRRTGTVFSASGAPVWTGLAASCARGASCAVNVTAALAAKARAVAASTQPLHTPPQPPSALRSRTQPIGIGALKIRSGRRANVTFSLTRSGAALLRKRHRLKLNLTITAPPARLNGRDMVIKRTITIVNHR